jgi:hypothetical protein
MRWMLLATCTLFACATQKGAVKAEMQQPERTSLADAPPTPPPEAPPPIWWDQPWTVQAPPPSE